MRNYEGVFILNSELSQDISKGLIGQLQEMVTKMRGIESGCKQAEGYIRHVQSPDFALPMAS